MVNGKDCMKKFCKSLREHTMEIINFKKKKLMKSWWKQMNSRNHMKLQKSAIFVKKSLKINVLKIKNIAKLGTIVIIKVNLELLHIAYVIQSIVWLPFYQFYHNKLGWRIWRTTDLFWKKIWKIHSLFSSNRKISYKNL